MITTQETKQSRVLIIDGLNTFIRSFMIIPITNSDGEHYGGVFGFLKSVKAAVEKFNPTEVVIAWDGPSGGMRRKTLFPEYKAHRAKEWKPGAIKAFDFLDEQSQRDNFTMQIRRVQEYLDVLPIKFIRIPYIEADDVIAVYAQTLAEHSHVVIYSSDADFKQLVTDKIQHYNPISKKLTTYDSFVEEFGIQPMNHIIFKSVSGDKSDNIPGVRGIGEATIKKLFPIVTSTSKITVEDILEEAHKLGFGKPKKLTSGQIAKYRMIAESADTLKRNFRLMQLVEPDISNQARQIVIDRVAESPQKFNSLKLKVMFIEDKLEKTVKRFDDWAHAFARLQTR